MFSQRTLLTSTVLLSLALPQAACTAIGYGIGSAIDAGNKESMAPERFAPDTIKPGREIYLKLRDGFTVHGGFIGFEQRPAEEYSASYAEARRRHLTVAALPELGDTVALRMTRGSELDAEFLGFDLFRVALRTPGHSEPEYVRPREIDEMQFGGGATIGGDVLALLLSEGALPFHSAVALQLPYSSGATGGQQLVPLDQVARIEWKSSSGRTAGLIIGGIIDLGLVTAVAICSAKDCLNLGMGVQFGSG